MLLKIYFLCRNFTFNTGTKPTEKSPKRFKKTYSGACIRVLNSNFWQKYFHKSGSLLQIVPRTDVPEKKKIWTVSGVLQAGSSGISTFLNSSEKSFLIFSTSSSPSCGLDVFIFKLFSKGVFQKYIRFSPNWKKIWRQGSYLPKLRDFTLSTMENIILKISGGKTFGVIFFLSL